MEWDSVGVGAKVPFVGRVAELDALRPLLAGAAAGRMRVALVEGEGGIGKSRLLRETVGIADEQGFLTLLGACDEMEWDRPLRAFSDALGAARPSLSPASAELPRLLERLAQPLQGVRDELVPAGASWVVAERVVDALEEMAAAGPVLLAIEDLQWADPLTLRSLRAVCRQLGHAPLAIVLTVRSGRHDAAVDHAVADVLDGGATHLVLAPLPREDAAWLASAVLGARPGPGLSAQVAGAGGNPLFLIELLHALKGEGAIRVAGGVADAATTSLPPSLRLTLLRRISLIPDAVLNLLRLASVLGSTFAVSDLALLAEQTVAQLLPAIVTATEAGLLVEAGDRLAFRHDLMRQAIYGDLPLTVRRGLHRQAAAALEDAGAPAERIAGHLVMGAEPGDADAVRWLRDAAQHSAPRDPITTVRLLERGLELVDAANPARDEIEAELIAPLVCSGRLRDAETLARGLLGRPLDPAVELLTRTGLASALSLGARYVESIEALESAARAASDWDRVSFAGATSVMMVLSGRLVDAVVRATQAVADGERMGNDYGRCLGLQALSMAALAEADLDRAIAVGEQAVQVMERADGAWASHVVPSLWLGTAFADADRFAAADSTLQMGRLRAERSGDIARLPLYHWAIADVRLGLGQWEDALAETEAGLALLEESGSHVGDVFAYAIQAYVAFHRGQLEVADAAVMKGATTLVAGPLEVGFEWMNWIRALLEEARGELSSALAILSDTWDAIAPLRYLQAASRPLALDLVRLAVAAGDSERAAAVADEVQASASRAVTPTTTGLVLRCQALRGDDPELFLAAVDAHRSGSRPLPLAAACEDAGVALGRHGRGSDSAPFLDEALVGYERLGAERDAARVRREQRAFGLRPRQRVARRPTFGWASITPTESKVIALVAEGLTNRQIGERLLMSRRTVATHIEHVLQKLGHANRVELAADATRRWVNAPPSQGALTAPVAAPANPRTPPLGHRNG